MEIDFSSIKLLRDYKLEPNILSPSTYYNFSPVLKPGYHYREINLFRKDPVCYIKHKTQDLWIYMIKGKLYFTRLIRNVNGFTCYKHPQVFFIEYLDHPRFMLYIQPHNTKTLFLVYKETSNSIYLGLTEDPLQATIFKYQGNRWNQLINWNVHAKQRAVGANKVRFYQGSKSVS